MSEKTEVLARVCAALLGGDREGARRIAREEYPFLRSQGRVARPRGVAPAVGPRATLSRKPLSFRQKLRVWLRDGFQDRDTGERLVFPGALELLSVLLPDEFPYHNPPHGDSRFTHQAMYELWPGIDHVVSHVGGDAVVVHAETNLVTMAHTNNLAKGSLGLGALGWTLRPASAADPGWDGLTGWFVAYLDRDPEPLGHPVSGARLQKWHRLLRRIRKAA